MRRHRTLAQEVQSGFKPVWTHPITPQRNAQLLTWWLACHDQNRPLAAALLGVDLRTLQRWIRANSLPLMAAVLLDQVKDGPAIQGAIMRRQIRLEWRGYLRTAFEPLRQLAQNDRGQPPSFGGWTFEQMAASPDDRAKHWREKRRASKKSLPPTSQTAGKAPAGSLR